MQQQGIQAIPLTAIEQDKPLHNLFYSLDQQEYVGISWMKGEESAFKEKQAWRQIEVEQVEKGYESEVGRGKQKKIKKKKGVIINREENRGRQKRVKFYVESLQNRVLQLENENRELKKLNKLNLQYIKKLHDAQQIINGFFITRHQLFRNIEEQTQSPNPSDASIIAQCLALRMKQGAYGAQRIRAINYYFKQMIQMVMPDAQKYIAQAADLKMDMFRDESTVEIASWRKQLLQKLNLSDEHIRQINHFGAEIVEKKKAFNLMIQQFHAQKCQLITQARSMEIIFQKFRNFLAPIQIARFLCYVEKCKFEQDLSIQSAVRGIYSPLEKDRQHIYKGNTFNDEE